MVCSPWKTYCKVRGFYLLKVIIFFIWRQGTLVNLHHWYAWDEDIRIVPGVDQLYQFPSRQMSQRTPSTTGPGHTTRHKKCKKRCKKLKKNGEWIKLYICRRSSYYSVLLKFLMFHSMARETTNQATTQIPSPTWQVYTLFPLWVGNLLPQVIDRSWYPDLIGLYIDMFW